MSIIKLAQKLNETYPEHTFVPVYWMATEDHDTEEISSVTMFGKNYRWQVPEAVPTGKLSTNSLANFMEELPELMPVFKQAYTLHNNLADATRHFVNELFGSEGLIILDADEPELKATFTAVIADDLIDHTPHNVIHQTNLKLEQAGYQAQAYVRPINFFCLDCQTRERIEKTDNDTWQVLNSSISYTKQEIADKIQQSPASFSPNVLLRPLYQEMVLPNLAYIGGPGELSYWMQLKDLFEHYKVPFPILIPRHFAFVINASLQRKLGKLELSVEELFLPEHELRRKVIGLQDNEALNLSDEQQELKALIEKVAEKAAIADPSLKNWVAAEGKKMEKIIDKADQRIRKSLEQQHDIKLRQLEGLLSSAFPDGHLQERKTGFMEIAFNQPKLIEKLLDDFTAFNFDLQVVELG